MERLTFLEAGILEERIRKFGCNKPKSAPYVAFPTLVQDPEQSQL